MVNINSITVRLFLGLAASAAASLIAFVATPIAIQLLGNLKFSQLSVWILYVAFVQIFEFGLSQYATSQCASTKNMSIRHAIISESTSTVTFLMFILICISFLLPKPFSEIYTSFSNYEWILFKISVVLNLQIAHHQSMLIMKNMQNVYTANQILLATLRYVVPIFIYYCYNDFQIVLFYQLFSAVAMSALNARQLGLPWHSIADPRPGSKLIARRIRPALLFYASSASAIILGVSDRVIASYLFDSFQFASYVATFSLASSLNIVVLPFSRIYTASLRPASRKFNQKNALRITAIQSYVCLLSASFVYGFSDVLFDMLGWDYPIDYTVLAVVIFSLWAVANGWIIATEIIINHRPMFQAFIISLALLIYLGYLALKRQPGLFDVSIIWAIHGFFQTFICPLWLTGKFRKKRYVFWQKHVVVFPLLLVGILDVLTLIFSNSSIWLSLVFFGLGSMLIGLMLFSKGSLHRLN